MDCGAAAHRLEVGVPATVEHSSEDGAEITKWVAETTQVSYFLFPLAIVTAFYSAYLAYLPSDKIGLTLLSTHRTSSHLWTL